MMGLFANYWSNNIQFIMIDSMMTSNIYTNIEAHILRSNMNSIHERHVSSQHKLKRMNHTFRRSKYEEIIEKQK